MWHSPVIVKAWAGQVFGLYRCSSPNSHLVCGASEGNRAQRHDVVSAAQHLHDGDLLFDMCHGIWVTTHACVLESQHLHGKAERDILTPSLLHHRTQG
jgi:hypothetical protein